MEESGLVAKQGHLKSEVASVRAAERSRSGDTECPRHLPQRLITPRRLRTLEFGDEFAAKSTPVDHGGTLLTYTDNTCDQ